MINTPRSTQLVASKLQKSMLLNCVLGIEPTTTVTSSLQPFKPRAPMAVGTEVQPLKRHHLAWVQFCLRYGM